MSTIKKDSNNSEVSRRILALRKLMELSQESFAEKMGVGRIAAVHWESGRTKPSAETYVTMAKVAKGFDPQSAVWFWEQVGVDRDALRDLLPEFNRLSMRAEQRAREVTKQAVDGTVRVPLLRSVASVKEPGSATEDQIEILIPLPASAVPNPTHTSCLWAPEEMRSMGVGSRDMLVIDSSNTRREELYEEIVVARDQKSGQSYVGYMEPFHIDSRRVPALTCGPADNEFPYLMRFQKSKSEKYKPDEGLSSTVLLYLGLMLPLSPERDWDILGRAISRIGYVKSSLIGLAKGRFTIG